MIISFLPLFLSNLILLTSPHKFFTSNYKEDVKDDQHNYVIPITRVPFLVLIAYHNLYCSGVLVKSRIIVTAASCFLPGYKNIKVVVKVGAKSIPSSGQIIKVLEVKIHEYFKHLSALDNDIAMVVLEDNVIFGANVKKAILVDTGVSLPINSIIGVAGWGSTNLKPNFVHKILYSEMTILGSEVCAIHFETLMTSSNFCAQYQSHRSLSDNGGPAIYQDVLVGILSYGRWDDHEPDSAIFTNVSYFHRWIATNSQAFLRMYCRPASKPPSNSTKSHGILDND